MSEFDWAEVKDAAESCRNKFNGTIPPGFRLALPRDTGEAIAEVAEQLFPDHEVVLADVSKPVFLAPDNGVAVQDAFPDERGETWPPVRSNAFEPPDPSLPVREWLQKQREAERDILDAQQEMEREWARSHARSMLREPKSLAEEQMGTFMEAMLGEIITDADRRRITRIVEEEGPVTRHQQMVPLRRPKLWVVSPNYATAQGILRLNLSNIRSVVITQLGELRGLRWQDGDMIVYIGTGWDLRILDELVVVGVPAEHLPFHLRWQDDDMSGRMCNCHQCIPPQVAKMFEARRTWRGTSPLGQWVDEPVFLPKSPKITDITGS